MQPFIEVVSQTHSHNKWNQKGTYQKKLNMNERAAIPRAAFRLVVLKANPPAIKSMTRSIDIPIKAVGPVLVRT